MTEAGWVILAGGGFLAFVGLMLWVFRIQYRWDRARIATDLAKRGFRLTSLSYLPFTQSAYLDIQERVYSASYIGQDGSERRACCRTSFLTGVSWSEEEQDDVKLSADDSPDDAADKMAVAQELKYRQGK